MRFFLPPIYKKKKKFQKQRLYGNESKLHLLDLKIGIAGLKALENGRITPRQLESVRQAITRKLQRTGKIWFYLTPEIAITRKPQEVRMGKGKGAIKLWIANIKAGKLIVEIANLPKEKAKEILLNAASKLPIKTLFLYKTKTLSDEEDDENLN